MISTSSQVALAELVVGGRSHRYLPLSGLLAPEQLAAIPYSTRILLENVARRAPDALPVALARVTGRREECEIPVRPNRIMLHEDRKSVV